jgi:hypothetical protein
MKMGRVVTNSQFAYPNSNVKALGPVRAEVTKSGWFSPPPLEMKDVKAAYNRALSQVEGANLLINYKEDTTVTYYPIAYFWYFTVKYEIEGQAARMTVGKQELH